MWEGWNQPMVPTETKPMRDDLTPADVAKTEIEAEAEELASSFKLIKDPEIRQELLSLVRSMMMSPALNRSPGESHPGPAVTKH